MNGCFSVHHYAYLFISLKEKEKISGVQIMPSGLIKKLILDPVYVYIKMCSTASHKDRLCAVLVPIIINQFSFIWVISNQLLQKTNKQRIITNKNIQT